jgi:hypothetical protein
MVSIADKYYSFHPSFSFPIPDTSWKFVPQIIKAEIAVNGNKNRINITEEQIQAAVDAIMRSNSNRI